MSNYVRFTLVLTIVCVAAGGGVGGVYLLTRGPIARKEFEDEARLRARVLPGAEVFAEVSPGSGVFAGRKSAGGPILGYVAVGEAGGYGGKLQVMVGLDAELVITKAAVLSHHETPGLGAECTHAHSRDTLWTVLFGRERSEGTSWMDQFAGKKRSQLVLGAGIDAKTGCTITGKAVLRAAAEAIAKVEQALARGTPPTETHAK